MPFSWLTGQMSGRFCRIGLALGCRPTIVIPVTSTGMTYLGWSEVAETPADIARGASVLLAPTRHMNGGHAYGGWAPVDVGQE
jgi:hypothetical protein